jgi:hypothetical protein
MRCALTDLEESSCAHCRGLSLATPSDVNVTHRFTSKFHSACENCERRVRKGDLIGRTDEGEYVCERCCK